MASYAPVVEESVFGELVMLSPAAQDLYGCLLNNGLYVFQPECNMHIAAMGWYYRLVRAVFIQSSQAAYVDICLGDEVTSPAFHSYFLSGIHSASFPDTLDRDCYVVFHPLQEKARSDQPVTMAIAIAEDRELPGMNLFYLHRNLEWRPYYRPRILDLPTADDLDEIEQQL